MANLEDINLKIAVETIGDIAAGVGLERLTEKILEFGKSVVDTGIQSSASIQNLSIAFQTAFGEKGAGQMLTAMNDLSYKTPFANEQLDAFALKLKNSGVELSKINPFLKNAGDIASGTGTSFEQMGNVLADLSNVYALANTRGAISSRMLLTVAREGIPIYQALADVMNKSGDGVNYTADMLAKGGKNIKITGENFQQAIQLLGSGKYIGDAQKQAESYTGSIKNMQAKLVDFGHTLLGVSDAGAILKGGLFDRLQQAGQGFFGFLQAHEKDIVAMGKGFADFANQIETAVRPALAFLGGVFKQMLMPVLGDLQKLWKDHQQTIKALAVLIGGTFVVALVGAVTLVSGLARVIVFLADKFSGLVEWIAQAITKIDSFLGKFNLFKGFQPPAISPKVPAYAGNLPSGGQGYAPQGGGNSYPNNSRSISISMQNDVRTQSDWSSIAREIGWNINGR
jgi:hypothetical protein